MVDNISERCKACDTLFASYFDEERGWEDLCSNCRHEALKDETANSFQAYEEWVADIEEVWRETTQNEVE